MPPFVSSVQHFIRQLTATTLVQGIPQVSHRSLVSQRFSEARESAKEVDILTQCIKSLTGRPRVLIIPTHFCTIANHALYQGKFAVFKTLVSDWKQAFRLAEVSTNILLCLLGKLRNMNIREVICFLYSESSSSTVCRAKCTSPGWLEALQSRMCATCVEGEAPRGRYLNK